MANEKQRPYAILFVDDELQALKWFTKAFKDDYTALTASSVDEALAMVDKGIDNLAVLITDQRMPEKTGVDLLAAMRQKHPRVIRMLTTAYSDTNSAIEAINTGAIYRYIVKPWNIVELRAIVRQAVELFELHREREILIREKLSVLQRIIIADRVQSLAVFATGLAHHIRNSMTALTYFLDLTPVRIREEIASESMKHPEFWGDIWSMALQQSHRILKIVSAVANDVVLPSGKFDAQIAIGDIFRHGTVLEKNGNVKVTGDNKVKSILANREMILKLFSILLARSGTGSESGAPVDVEVSEIPDVWGTPGIQVHFSGKGPGWNTEKLVGLFTPFCQIDNNPQDLGLDLLSAFFIAHHHGGDLLVHKSPQSPGFILHLPYDPSLTVRPSLEQDCLEKVFARFSDEEAV